MSEWIRVEDRLPEEGDDILAYGCAPGNNQYITMNVTYVFDKEKRPIWRIVSSGCGCCDWPMVNVTHWMPLPEEPNEN